MKKIPEEKIQEICGYIRIGASFATSILTAEFTEDEGREIQNKINKAKTGFWKNFGDDIKRAYAQFEILQLQRVIQDGGASGAKWILEKIMPEKYGNKQKPIPPRNSQPQIPILEEKESFEDDVLEIEEGFDIEL